eukprot:2832286-Pyramimonas_sp.AAC.1
MAQYSFSPEERPMTCSKLHPCFTQCLPMNATCPTVDLRDILSPALSESTMTRMLTGSPAVILRSRLYV